MKTLTKMLAPLAMLTFLFAIPAKSQDLIINRASQVQDTIPLGSSVSLGWQIANAGSDSVNTDNGVDVLLTIGGDSVSGIGLPFQNNIPTNAVFPQNPNQLPLSAVLDRSEYQEGTTDICLIVTNKTGQNQGRDTFCQTVYLRDAALDIGVDEVILPGNNNEVFRDSLLAARLVIQNFGNDFVRDSFSFPVRGIVESPGNRILDTFTRNVSFDTRLMAGQKDTVSTILYVSPATDTGSYNYSVQTRLANSPLSADPDSTNDETTVQIDVINKYNLTVGFANFEEGDKVIKGSRINAGVLITNQGPGLVDSFQVNTQNGTQNFPGAIIDKLNAGVNGNFSDQNEVSRQVTGRLPIGGLLNPAYGISTRIDANTQDDTLQLCAFHESRISSELSLNIAGNTLEFNSIVDTTCINLIIESKDLDVGMTSISPVDNNLQTDSANAFEITLKNFSNEAVNPSTLIPASIFITDIGFSLGTQINIPQGIPANGTLTDTINIDLRQAEDGNHTLSMETVWDVSQFNIDNNPANDTASTQITIGEVDGIADHSMVESTNIYPNPAEGNTQLTYSLQESQQVTVTLQNMKGQTMKVIQQGRQNGGEQTINFSVDGLSAGTYLYNIQTEKGQTTGRLVVK